MRTSLFVGLSVLSVAVSSEAAAPDWVGVDRCGSCHASQLAAWQRGPHRLAYKSIASAGGPQGERCATCHRTGDAPSGSNKLLGVQCEACHGAGLHYAEHDIMQNPTLSRSLGLRSLATETARQEVCTGCHTGSTSLQAFDVERAWAEIAH